MKVYNYIFLLIISCNLCANQNISLFLERSEKQASQEIDQQDNQEKVECALCKRTCLSSESVDFCRSCGNKICSSCEFGLTLEEKIFLDKDTDYFFVKVICSSCGKEVAVYGSRSSKRSYRRMCILMSRVQDDKEEYTSVRNIQKECANIVC